MIKRIQKILYKLGYQVYRVKKTGFYLEGDWFKKINIANVIDIGANEGQFSLAAKKYHPEVNIIAFEPLKGCYTILSENVKDLGVNCYNYGLSNQNTEAEIHVSGNLVSSSLLPMNDIHQELYPQSTYTAKEKIKLIRLDDFFEKHSVSLQGNTLIKVDVQGFEENVLKGGFKTFSDASVVVIETSFIHMYKGQWLFDDVYMELRRMGFVFIGLVDQELNKNLKIPMYGDGLFIKKELIQKIY